MWKVDPWLGWLTVAGFTCFAAGCALANKEAEVWFEAVEGASFGFGWCRFSVCDFCGSAMVCYGYRERLSRPRPWFEALAACCMCQFGGTTLVGLALGQPPSWMCSHNAPRSLLLVFWLTFSCPLDMFHRFLRSSEMARLCLSIGMMLSSAHAATSWGAEKAIKAQHESAQGRVFLTLICGTLGSCGGSLFADHLRLFGDGGRSSPASVKKAAVGSVLYYLLRDPDGFIWREAVASPAQARLGICLYSLAASLPAALLKDPVLAQQWSPQARIERLIASLLGLPNNGLISSSRVVLAPPPPAATKNGRRKKQKEGQTASSRR